MEEKKQIKVSLGTTICIFIIILLIIALTGMYLYFNKDSKNSENNITKVDAEVEIQQDGKPEIYNISDFELINRSLINTEYNNLKSFITSDNEIEEVSVNAITIYTEEYLKAKGKSLFVDCKENEIAGSCVFTIRFKDIEGLALAGSKGEPHGIVGNCLVDQKEFVFDKTTNKIEICTELVWKENDESKEEEKNNISETISKLSKADSEFGIENIVKKGNKYEITAYILQKEPRKISKEEYESVLKGKTLTFKNMEWKYEKDYFENETEELIYIKSGEQLLSLAYDSVKKEGYVENIAGAKTGGLRDYSKEKVVFEVSEDIIIGDPWNKISIDNKGNVAIDRTYDIYDESESCTINKLLEVYNNKGSYGECKAYVLNNEVVAIETLM